MSEGYGEGHSHGKEEDEGHAVGQSEGRPWRRALGWLVLLGPFFFASYGFANWLASRRPDVGSVVFPWEHAIPFVPWTILPYWSIDVLYVVSIFVCTTRRELDRHAQRLLVVQVIAVSCFLLFPLQFSFDRPETEGLFGVLFAALGAFDKPFNQAPSLHIALLVLVWERLAVHVRGPWRMVLHAWMALIGVSVLTTYQHHFVDVPTGVALGFLALWVLPVDTTSPLAGLSLTDDPKRRRLALYYGVGALVVALPAARGGTFLWLLWPAVALALVAAIYSSIGADGFQKSDDGRLSAGARGLLAPYLLGAWINSRLWTRRHPYPVEVVEGIWLGRMPGAGDMWDGDGPASAIVDLTAELSCGAAKGRLYETVPVLDLTVPTTDDLRRAADAIDDLCTHGPVLVCCALGYSRSAAAVVAWLLSRGHAATVREAVEVVRTARPSIVLGDRHREALEAFV